MATEDYKLRKIGNLDAERSRINELISLLNARITALESSISGGSSGGISDGTPSGPAGGSLTGYYPNPAVADSGVTSGTYGSSTKSVTLSIGKDGRVTAASENTIASGIADGDYGDITASSGGTVLTIDNQAVSYAKIQNVSAASKLLGRGDSGSGSVQEITLGTNLSMSGTTLNATGGGSTGGAFGATFNGGLSVISTGATAVVGPMPYGGTITEVDMLADVSGSAVCDIRKCTYSTYDTASSICASAKPTLSSTIKSQDTTLTGWTTAFSTGDIFLFVIESASAIKKLTTTVKVTKL